MQLLPVYTGFIMQAILGVLMETAGQPCPQEKGEFTINFNLINGSREAESLCYFTEKRKLRKMFCPDGHKCKNEDFQVFVADPNEGCTIRKPRDIIVYCSFQSDSNLTICKGTGFLMPVDCVVKVNCLTERIHFLCKTTFVPTSQPQETSTPSTITSATTTVKSSSTSTTTKSTTISISTDTSTVYRSTTSVSLTHLTTTSVGILASSSSDAVSQASTASNTATLVGGVVGGVLAGVVITVVVVVVWWKCRRRSEIQDDGKRESHICHGLAPVGFSDHGAPTAVPDVIKVSQAARDTSPIPDFRSENQGETSGQETCCRGDYTYIKEVELEEDGAYSLGKGFPNTVSFKDLAKSGIDSGSGQITDTYNRLGAHAVTSTPQTDTYNRIGGERKDGKIIKDSDEMHPSSDYFVLESSTDQEDTYNRLTAGDEPCGQHHNSTYNRIGETDVEHREGMDQELTLPDYLILEKADIPGTQDDYNRLGYVSSDTLSSNLKNT